MAEDMDVFIRDVDVVVSAVRGVVMSSHKGVSLKTRVYCSRGIYDVVVDADIYAANDRFFLPEVYINSAEMRLGRNFRYLNLEKMSKNSMDRITSATIEAWDDAVKAERESMGVYD